MAHPPGKTAGAVAYLRARIASGEWTVNARIPAEAELLSRIGVGKSTLREAIQALVQSGMLEPVRGVGTFVRSQTPVDGAVAAQIADRPFAEVLGLRRALEIEAARQAALRRTPDQVAALRSLLSDASNPGAEHTLPAEHAQGPGSFHQLLFEAAGNALARDLYAAVLAAIRTKRSAGDDAPARAHDHAAIAEAVASGDPARAAVLMARHVDRDIVAERAGDA
ncbi:FadR/GntR family transcriptional regulator [Microbacterium indicum]|uniref:FadR/GntR family transcriptional regulator n=1 Tax=Microbacterium indicum TaxID=358100 RepID=UPI00040DB2D9|nr:FCD domain-containing protein [Microbacterium indicum]